MRGITDPTAKAYWREYQQVLKEGNPLGLSFVDFIVQREGYGPRITSNAAVKFYVGTCGHRHPLGEGCSSVTFS